MESWNLAERFTYDELQITTQPSRSHHQPPQAELFGKQATFAADRLSGASDGRQDMQRIFFIILSLTARISMRFPALFERYCAFEPASRGCMAKLCCSVCQLAGFEIPDFIKASLIIL